MKHRITQRRRVVRSLDHDPELDTLSVVHEDESNIFICSCGAMQSDIDEADEHLRKEAKGGE